MHRMFSTDILYIFQDDLACASYFFLDGLPKPWFVLVRQRGLPIDMGLFLAIASVVLIVSQLMQRRPRR
jgi:hypothetical protein